ncbi:hypothetical protein, partial [Streptomyces parvus]|uniref:hypothetical protein n=1 Tax=Streptomyces parvus TaxID=66428 RepID=UPI0033EFEEAF
TRCTASRRTRCRSPATSCVRRRAWPTTSRCRVTGHADWLRAVREAQDAADRELAAGLAALTGSRTRSPGDGGVR